MGSLFGDFPPRVVFILISTCTEQIFAPGDLIVRQGEMADCMYIILRGSVSVLIDDEQEPTAMLSDYQYFGEVCMLEKLTRTSSIRAEAWTLLSRLDKDRFDMIVEDYPDMQEMIRDRFERKFRKYRKSVVKEVPLNSRRRVSCYPLPKRESSTGEGESSVEVGKVRKKVSGKE